MALAIKRQKCPCDNGDHSYAKPGREYTPAKYRDHCLKQYHRAYMYDDEREKRLREKEEFESLIRRLNAKLKVKNKRINKLIDALNQERERDQLD